MKTPEDWPHKEEAIYRPSVETPTLEIQYAQIKDAMLQYHQTTFLPNNRFMLEACQQFTQTPSSSSTTPRFRLIQWTTASRPLRPRWATKLFYFGVYQPLDSPSTTSTGTSNTFATLSTRGLRTDHLYACQWYSDNIDKFIRCNQKTILDNRQISFKDNSDIHPAGVPCIPWYILVASSVIIAIDSIDEQFLQQHPNSIDDGFVEALLAPYYPDRELWTSLWKGSPATIWRTWAQFAIVSLM